MRSILEQAVLHHLNGEDDRANELFHQFIVARARQIHESMRNGEEDMDLDDAMSEEYFSDVDLSELEDNPEEPLDGADDAEADLDAELNDEEAIEDDIAAADDSDLDVDMEDEESEVSAEEIADMKAELEALIAEFSDLKAELGKEEEEDEEEFDMDMDMDAEEPIEDDSDMDMEEPVEDDEDEDFKAMGESIASELEKVNVSLKSDGKLVGAGDTIAQNRKSPIPQKKAADRQAGAKPTEVHSKDHKHFNRETAPAVQAPKARRNTLAKAKDSLSPVKK